MSGIVNLQDWKEEHPQDPDSQKKLFLTESQVRAYPHFKDASPEEIINIINTLHQLALITYELVSQELNAQTGIPQAA
jgi:ribosomal protein S15P/S13E